MTLLDICEPLFQYICCLNRSVRTGGIEKCTVVETKIDDIFRQMKLTAAARPDLMAGYEKVELPLIFFVDSMIWDSRLPFAKEWPRIAFERGEKAGDEKFFLMLEDTLKEGEAAAGRLAVFCTCLGLGFTGIYAGRPDDIRQKMSQCARWMRGMIETNESAMICPDAYKVDESNHIEPPGVKLAGMGIMLVGLVLVLFIANVCWFRMASKDLGSKVGYVIKWDENYKAKRSVETDHTRER